MMNLIKKLREFLSNQDDQFSYMVKKLRDIDYKVSHIEDAIIDHRQVLIKLVKQGNSLVAFLNDIDVPGVNQRMEIMGGGTHTFKETFKEREEALQKLAESLNEKVKGLKEFEKELEKHRDKINPGQIGES